MERLVLTFVSAALALCSLGALVVAVGLLAGWDWSLLALPVPFAWASYVVSTHVAAGEPASAVLTIATSSSTSASVAA